MERKTLVEHITKTPNTFTPTVELGTKVYFVDSSRYLNKGTVALVRLENTPRRDEYGFSIFSPPYSYREFVVLNLGKDKEVLKPIEEVFLTAEEAAEFLANLALSDCKER